MRLAGLLALVMCSGCLKGWSSEGPWACEADGGCPGGYTCDDGVCCSPGNTPACPTLPVEGACPEGNAPTNYYRDGDGDGVGDTTTGRPFCRTPQLGGWVAASGDCDDSDPFISPRASERCNALDDDCDGVIDNGLSRFNWYVDADHDTFGVNGPGLQACAQPDGGADRAGDCDDSDPTRHPGADERCDGIDNNCNGQPDDGPFADTENPGINDGHNFPCDTGQSGVCSTGGFQCVYASGVFTRSCVAKNFPTVDVCGDGLDNDCNGAADNAPGCGGPSNLVSEPGLTMSAFRIINQGTINPVGCLRDTTGTEPTSWVRPSWLATNASHVSSPSGDFQVLYADAPRGTWWDLSSGAALSIVADASLIGGLDAGFNGDQARLPTLSVQFCGEDGGWSRATPSGAQLMRIADIAAGGVHNQLLLPLRTSGGGWTYSAGTGLDWRRVNRVEFIATPYSMPTLMGNPALTTITITFSADGGFGFR